MQYTANLNLKKPDYTDPVDIQDINSNMDIIDTSLDNKVDKSQVLTNVPSDAKFTDTIYKHPTGAGNNHIPTGGSVGQVLKNTASGAATWQNEADTITTINSKTGAISKEDIVALGIPAQDTVYTHPATHAAGMITGLPTSLPANGGNADTVGGKTIWIGAEASKGTSANTLYFCY